MSNEQISSQYTAEYQNISPSLPGQTLPWLQSLRSDGFKRFSGKGFPSVREEEWRYTNVSAIEKKLFSPSIPDWNENEVENAWLKPYQIEDAWLLVLVNGRYSPQLSMLDGLPEDISVLSLAAALEQQAEQVEKYLAQAVGNDEHNFVAFNSAWFSDGVFVNVPENTVLEKPLQILNVVTQADYLATTRNLIVVGEQADAKIIETFVGQENSYLSAAVTEIFVSESAVLELYKLQLETEKAYHFGGTYVKQQANSHFKHHNFAFGGLLARTDIHTDLDLASQCDLNGLYLGSKRQHIDNHTRINHLKPEAVSREQYKGVLDQRSRGIFQGRVIVAEDAQKTDSEMNNRNLLLSDDAEVDTKPQLEIYADDVKCAHGVTVGQLDEKSIFYLQSRCVDEETARNILTFAFANEMVNKIEIKALHDLILAQLLQRFPQQGVDMEWL